MLEFSTEYIYTDRETKAEYVWLKYRSILSGKKILDVGADECYLKKHLDEHSDYWGIGRGEVDQMVDLECGKLPFKDNDFDTVLCLDVLEHIENIHHIFDELCRVSRRYVIVSLPNSFSAFWSYLRFGDYSPGVPIKFHGIPPEPPEDRHKWFFSHEDAVRFVRNRAEKNNMRIVQIDTECLQEDHSGIFRQLKTRARNLFLKSFFRNDLNPKTLYASTLWTVLEKQSVRCLEKYDS